MRAVVVDVQVGVELVGLVDGGDGEGEGPEVGQGDVVADAAEFALDGDAAGVVGGGGGFVELEES